MARGKSSLRSKLFWLTGIAGVVGLVVLDYFVLLYMMSVFHSLITAGNQAGAVAGWLIWFVVVAAVAFILIAITIAAAAFLISSAVDSAGAARSRGRGCSCPR